MDASALAALIVANVDVYCRHYGDSSLPPSSATSSDAASAALVARRLLRLGPSTPHQRLQVVVDALAATSSPQFCVSVAQGIELGLSDLRLLPALGFDAAHSDVTSN